MGPLRDESSALAGPRVGLLFLAHSGFDRMLGYGLKSGEGFQVTHLGTTGKMLKVKKTR